MELGAAFSSPLASPRSPSADAGFGAGREATGNKPEKPTQPGATSSTGEPLSKEQEAQVRELKKRDAEVKAHEQAHATVGGAYASAPKYTYTRGPDGKKYAVGGEVQIDTSPERTPDATIRKMDIVIRAALAPAEPSSQDRAVARQAQQQRLEAQQQVAQQQASERKPGAPEEVESAGAVGMEAGLLAQIMSQADGDTSTQANGSSAASAASAYQSTAGLAAQLFGGAS
ncbi:MAG: hypothetical protein JJ908_04815 [Rhizobiales bacterium]|nr:hypothetical protein [Hyphomicrobiales bacterium]MBO6698076.1 hypothetical protein [Hyphomicrobiales bacterium]MBO6735670.1 hypothetical protein [Hyphomicrobiales bacterium]MBO6910522.1 hypothetical protein [Hyphomicrobiales bacterium]MBO6956127.1 hypothetical protein [Hyphomicrobiales bacterium]